MDDKTVSATYDVAQINELLVTPVYYSSLRPHVELIVETASVSFNPDDLMSSFRLYQPDSDSQLKYESNAWEAASDDDLAHFENSL